MLKQYLAELGREGQRANPLFAFLGVRVRELGPDRVVLCLPFQEGFIQGGGVIAGGVMAALADEAMAHVVLANLAEGKTTATIEMNLRFLRPAREGDLEARAALVKKGRTVITASAEVWGSSGEALAVAGASFMVVDAE